MNGQACTIFRLRLIATALAMCVVYQLGACPCGCLEHNYWIQALGAVEDHHHTTNLFDGFTAIIGEHECSSESHELYFDNSNHSDEAFRISVDFQQVKIPLSGICNVTPKPFQRYRGPPDNLFLPLHQAAFQVFLL